MRKTNQEITDNAILEEILSDSEICRIAMNDGGVPYILPFNYGYKYNCIYIHSALEGKKIDLLKNNKKVCFEIEQKAELIKHKTTCGWATKYRSVVGYGEVEIVNDFSEKEKGLNIIMAHNGGLEKNSFEKKNVDRVLVLKLKIDKLKGKQSSNWNKETEKKIFNIESENLQLIEISEEDIEEIHRLHSIPEVEEFNTIGIPDSIKETKKLMLPVIDGQSVIPRKSYTWKILLKESGEFIGLAGMFLSNDKFRLGEFYYKLFPGFWGKGFATETSKRLIKAGFEDFGLHKVEAGVATGNTASIRVLEKSGMAREGLRRKILPIHGEWVDNYHYAIVEDDLRDY
ncbi:MAG: GNAT family N-acetyltransferase [Mariniphaga sp.]|nr:GNAT family N-acetyltransferase [Mariniphaga sp.]